MKYAIAMALILNLAFTMSATQSDADLIIYYDYEEIQDGWILDRSGNGIDGRIEGTVSLADGPHGKAGFFEKGSYLDLDGPNVPQDLIPKDAFSITAWVSIENTGEHHAIFNARASDEQWIIHPEVRDTSNQYRWLLRTDMPGGTIFDIRAGGPKVGAWVHFAGTYSRADGVGILYIDGEEVGREDAREADVPVAGDWGLGARVGYNIDNARPFTGMMDDFTIWNVALTPDEVIDVMDNGPPGVPTSVAPEGKLATTWGNLKQF